MSSTGRVLVVEVGESAGRSWSARLRALGYEVHTARTLDEAERIGSLMYLDLVLVHDDPGGLDALAVVGRLRALESQEELPGVIAGNDLDAHRRSRAIDGGADDYFHAGIEDVDLGVRLRGQLRLRRLRLELRARLDAPAPSSSAEHSIRGGKVLVVDDDPVWGAILSRRLEDDGYTVVVADDLPVAERSFEGFDPDVAIVDLMLPSGSGVDFVRAQRRLRRGRHMPSVIVVTGRDDIEGKLEALRLGADDYLVKPVDPSELAARVLAQVRRSRANRALRLEVDRARREANQDALTKLYNRRFLEADLARRVEHAGSGPHPFSVILLDIDHFKSINDEYGHALGDQVLALVAACVSAQLREGDLVCRYGGEEFCVVLPATTLAQAATCAERLRRAVEWLACPPLSDGRPTISLGVAAWVDGESPSELLERADAAMYRAKKTGRNRVAEAREGLGASSRPSVPEASSASCDK